MVFAFFAGLLLPSSAFCCVFAVFAAFPGRPLLSLFVDGGSTGASSSSSSESLDLLAERLLRLSELDAWTDGESCSEISACPAPTSSMEASESSPKSSST